MRIWSFYTDDIVHTAKNKEASIDIVGTLKKFLKDKKLSIKRENKDYSI